jgi:hypothetical protein
MTEPVHVHAPEELTDGEPDTTSRARHRLELVATLLLAASTIAIAWSGYQAARWSGFQTELYASATHTRTFANREEAGAGQGRVQDVVSFNRWLEVTTQGDASLADLYRRGFRAPLERAFEAWLAQEDPLTNPTAKASPLQMPEYRLPGLARAARFDEQADRLFDRATEATDITDDYILVTVFLAVVLFFAGISLRFTWHAARIAVLALGGVFLAFSVVRLLDLPVH